MKIVGPLWGELPTTSTTAVVYTWYWLWIDERGRVIAREWQSFPVSVRVG